MITALRLEPAGAAVPQSVQDAAANAKPAIERDCMSDPMAKGLPMLAESARSVNTRVEPASAQRTASARAAIVFFAAIVVSIVGVGARRLTQALQDDERRPRAMSAEAAAPSPPDEPAEAQAGSSL